MKRNGIPLVLFIGLLSFKVIATTENKKYFVQPFYGYNFVTSKFELDNTQIQSKNKLTLKEAADYGLMFGVMTPDPGNIYLLYSHMDTELEYFKPQALNSMLTSLALDYVHIGGSLYFPYQHWKNYVSVSLGLTSFRPDISFSNETRFSMGLSLGNEYFVTKYLSFTTDVRAFATFIDSNNDFLCADNQCMLHIDADVFWQGQVNLAAKITF